MSLNVEEIKAALIYGGARPTHFEVTFNAPPAIATAGSLQNLSVLCKATTIPPSTIETMPVFYKGRQVKLAGDRTFAAWQVTLINDEDYALHRVMMSWSQAIDAHEAHTRNRGATGDPYSYKVDATIVQLSKVGGIPVWSCNIVGMWPQEVGAIELNYDTPNTIEEFQVTFEYDYTTTADTDGVQTADYSANLLR